MIGVAVGAMLAVMEPSTLKLNALLFVNVTQCAENPPALTFNDHNEYLREILREGLYYTFNAYYSLSDKFPLGISNYYRLFINKWQSDDGDKLVDCLAVDQPYESEDHKFPTSFLRATIFKREKEASVAHDLTKCISRAGQRGSLASNINRVCLWCLISRWWLP